MSNFVKLCNVLLFLIFCASPAMAQKQEASETDTLAEIENLKIQIKNLQQQLEQKPSSNGNAAVNLSGEELPSLAQESSKHVLARPWFRKIDISGFGSASFLDSGEDGTHPEGGFAVCI